MTRAIFHALLWAAGLAVVTAAWILAWRSAPFAGWDFVFYGLLPAFLVCTWGIYEPKTLSDLQETAALTPDQRKALKNVRKGPSLLAAPLLLFGGKKPLFEPPSLLETLWVLALGAGVVAGTYYSFELLRTEPQWAVPRIGAPLLFAVAGFLIGDTRAHLRFKKQNGGVLPDDR